MKNKKTPQIQIRNRSVSFTTLTDAHKSADLCKIIKKITGADFYTPRDGMPFFIDYTILGSLPQSHRITTSMRHWHNPGTPRKRTAEYEGSHNPKLPTAFSEFIELGDEHTDDQPIICDVVQYVVINEHEMIDLILRSYITTNKI